MSVFVTALGWVGAALCLTAYICVTRGTWSPTSGRYQLANVLSGIMLGTVAANSGVWPSVVTNFVWAAVALHAVTVLVRARRARTGTTTADWCPSQAAVDIERPVPVAA